MKSTPISIEKILELLGNATNADMLFIDGKTGYGETVAANYIQPSPEEGDNDAVILSSDSDDITLSDLAGAQLFQDDSEVPTKTHSHGYISFQRNDSEIRIYLYKRESLI